MDFNTWQKANDSDWQKFANDMIVYRAKNKLTQTAFAKKCGVSFSSINLIENCKRKVQYNIVYKISEVINKC